MSTVKEKVKAVGSVWWSHFKNNFIKIIIIMISMYNIVTNTVKMQTEMNSFNDVNIENVEVMNNPTTIESRRGAYMGYQHLEAAVFTIPYCHEYISASR